MTAIHEIISQRDAAITVLDDQIGAANRLRNNGAQGMDEKINALEQKKAEIAAQAYEAALNEPAMAKALATLKAVTDRMNEVAQNMVTATAFIAHFNDLIAASNKVIPALKGIG